MTNLYLSYPHFSSVKPQTELIKTPKGLFIIINGTLICHNSDDTVGKCTDNYLSKYWKFYETSAGYKIKSNYKIFYFLSKQCLTFDQGNAVMESCDDENKNQLWIVSDENNKDKNEDNTSYNKSQDTNEENVLQKSANTDKIMDLSEYKKEVANDATVIADEMQSTEDKQDSNTSLNVCNKPKNKKKHKLIITNDNDSEDGQNKPHHNNKKKVENNANDHDLLDECEKDGTIDILKLFDIDGSQIPKKRINCDRKKIKHTLQGILGDIKAVDYIISNTDNLKQFKIDNDDKKKQKKATKNKPHEYSNEVLVTYKQE
ncbi:hypothetical protein BDAP_000991 [Binucleata daphniae]